VSTPATFPLTPELAALTGRVALAELYPPFAALYIECLGRCLARGIHYYSISGLRSWEEQEKLYAKGRLKRPDGSWLEVHPNLIVTKALPGKSDHQYGIAADSCRDEDTERAGLQPTWKMASYHTLAEEAREVGLTSLYYSKTFPEGPHVALDYRRHGITLSHLSDLYVRGGGGLPAVWAYLDTFDWGTP